jgi:hypothetical protein
MCLLTTCGVAHADIVLSGAQHEDVTTSHSSVELYDSSSVNLMPSGYVGTFTSYDNAGITIDGGTVGNSWSDGGVRAYNSSTVNVLSGEGGFIFGYDNSTVNVQGGTVSGTIYDYALRAYGNSTMNISGGTMTQVHVNDFSIVNITGGTIDHRISEYYTFWAIANSQVNISGGSIGSVAAANDATIRFYGYDFQASGGLVLDGENVIGTGTLSGKWNDGTPWTTIIQENYSTASIVAVPEPSSVILLLIGSSIIAGYRNIRKSYGINL